MKVFHPSTTKTTFYNSTLMLYLTSQQNSLCKQKSVQKTLHIKSQNVHLPYFVKMNSNEITELEVCL